MLNRYRLSIICITLCIAGTQSAVLPTDTTTFQVLNQVGKSDIHGNDLLGTYKYDRMYYGAAAFTNGNYIIFYDGKLNNGRFYGWQWTRAYNVRGRPGPALGDVTSAVDLTNFKLFSSNIYPHDLSATSPSFNIVSAPRDSAALGVYTYDKEYNGVAAYTNGNYFIFYGSTPYRWGDYCDYFAGCDSGWQWGSEYDTWSGQGPHISSVPTAYDYVIYIGCNTGCNVIWNYDSMGTGALESITCGWACNQVPGRVYQVGSACYKAITSCNGCLKNPTRYPTHLQLVECNPCPDCTSCGNGNPCLGDESCISTHQDYCKPTDDIISCSPDQYGDRSCHESSGDCLHRCNVIWDNDVEQWSGHEAVTCSWRCNQVPGRVYKKNSQCWKALTSCHGCVNNPSAYPEHLQLVDCNPCPDCTSCGTGSPCLGEESCITTHDGNNYCQPAGFITSCSADQYGDRSCHESSGDCLHSSTVPIYTPEYGFVIFIGIILLIVVNNLFICYWCLCRDKNKIRYQTVNEEENDKEII